MSAYSYSVALITPAGMRADANRLACAIGYDALPGATFVAKLSATGAPPASHYGAHAYAAPAFVAIIRSAQAGSLPPVDWPAYGLSPVRVTQLFAAMTVVSRQAHTPAAWAAALTQTGLQAIIDPAPDDAP